MKRTIILLLLAVFAVLLPREAQADPQADRAAVTRIYTMPLQADWFGAALLAQVSIDKLRAIVTSEAGPLGKFRAVTGPDTKGTYLAQFDNGDIPTTIHIDAAGKIDGIFFSTARNYATTVAQALTPIRALPGTVSYTIWKNGKELRSRGQEQALSVGSTFKLAVLNALQDEISSGARRWSDVVSLDPNRKTLGSGFLQTWPSGTALTLQTLADLMISQSDNTAADTLLHLVGSKALAPYAYANDPFLSTRQMFQLKAASNRKPLDAYRAGSAAQRRAILAKIDMQPLPTLASLDMRPTDGDIDWHFTNEQLCTLMSRVEHLPLMTINPGVQRVWDWKRIAYKGGSEAGVMSMTTWLAARDGSTYCVSVTENAPTAIDEPTFASLYFDLVGSLAAKPTH